MTGVRLRAPAKVNWTLEVLGRRPDGYHEIRSVMQTIDLCDAVTLRDAKEVTLELAGEASLLSAEDPQRNLAYRAAQALRDHAKVERGVAIELEKRIPVAAGLGGGSSDTAAVLRGCNVLWGLALSDETLIDIGSDIGSDVPFFIVGGTASVSGRGEQVSSLDDARRTRLLLSAPDAEHRGEKTASMYARLSSDQYTDGEATRGLEEIVNNGRELTDGVMVNVFGSVVADAQPATARTIAALRARGLTPHLAGSGPSLFLIDTGQSERLVAPDAAWRRVATLGRAEALRVEAL